LQEWYEAYWNEAEDVSADILRVIQRHTQAYTPFEIYAKSLQEFFRGHEMTPSEWEQSESKMFPVLDQYQQEGYQALMKIARQYGGAFLCDGVGLGKTFVGLMLIERLVMHERKRVALFVPKAARKDVWEVAIRQYLPHVGGLGAGVFSNLIIFNHTDLNRGGDFPVDLQRVKEFADVIIIDEAHHFRNPGVKGIGKKRPSRYRMLYDLIDGPNRPKQMFMLTATPVNNRLSDFRHMMELFTRQDDGYFSSTLGIHSIRGHFIKMEKDLEQATDGQHLGQLLMETNMFEFERTFGADTLFKSLVLQRSRAYVKESQMQQGSTITSFPTREEPKVADYSVKKSYGRLLEMMEKAFSKKHPLFVLGMYYPYAYYKGDDESIDPFTENRQKQVVSLIRTQFLKRFESSAHAFERSCERLLKKLLAWAMVHTETDHEKRLLERWKLQNAELIDYVQLHQMELWGDNEEELDEDFIPEEMLEDVEELSRDEFKVEEILADIVLDLDQIAEFLNELKKFEPKHDDKLKALLKLLKNNPVLSKHKVLIFTEFAETAHYLKKQLQDHGIKGVEQIDSSTKKDRSEIIRRFAPYYNGSSSPELQANGEGEIRILISTDVLSEGLNLQDATRLINYDLHWNPVRLMQRIGRVDRRMNEEVEKRLIQDHPEQKKLRGKIAYWNFLPPDELEVLLNLYTKVSNKTLRISKTFGIEGKKLLTPEDDFDALKNFNQSFEGTTSPVEKMKLEYKQLLLDNPELETILELLPGRVFSGKQHPRKGTRAVFFCYRIPRPDHSLTSEDGEHPWTEDAGQTKWLLFTLSDGKVIEDATEIVEVIRSAPDTPRTCEIEQQTLSDIRKKVETQLKNSVLKKLQAPVGIKPLLKAWMELN